MRLLLPSLAFLLMAIDPVTRAEDKREAPSLDEDWKALEGEWVHSKPADWAKIEIEFKRVKGEPQLYVAIYRKEDLPDSPYSYFWGKIRLQGDAEKRYFELEGKVKYQLSNGKLVLDGETQNLAGRKVNLSGEWTRAKSKKKDE
jgi:hypothetical protein